MDLRGQDQKSEDLVLILMLPLGTDCVTLSKILHLSDFSFLIKLEGIALASVAELVGHHSVKQRVAGSIPSQGTCVVGLVPLWGGYESNQLMFLSHINISLPLFLHPILSL